MGDPARPRVAGRLALLVGLTLLCDWIVLTTLFTGRPDCSTAAQCRARDVVVGVTAFGGWAGLVVVGVVAVAAGRAAAAKAASAALVVATAVAVLGLPSYALFRDGTSGITHSGRERRHLAARARIVEVVDGTARAIRPGPARVEHSPGTREENDFCETEMYLVELDVRRDELAPLATAAAEHWRSLGLDVRLNVSEPGHPSAWAVSGEVRFSLIGDDYQRPVVKIYGSGPCLRR